MKQSVKKKKRVLALNKSTIAHLNLGQMSRVEGGGDVMLKPVCNYTYDGDCTVVYSPGTTRGGGITPAPKDAVEY